MKCILRNLFNGPYMIMVTIICVVLLEPYVPVAVKGVLYAISLSVKSIIVFLLPCIIFGLLFKVTVDLASSATYIIALTLGMVCCSNFTTTMISYFISSIVYNFDLSIIAEQQRSNTLTASSYCLTLPHLIDNSYAMCGGIIGGIALNQYNAKFAKLIAGKMATLVTTVLTAVRYLILPFVIGFIIKLQHDGVITNIVKDYASILVVVIVTQVVYITFIYLVISGFDIRNFIKNVKDMLPAGITAFSTMSSAATMPVTIIGAEKNTFNKDLVRSIIPITVNIHLMGDCLVVPIYTYAILKTYSMPVPTFLAYMVFAIHFIMTKFSVVAIPGGGIIVMLPILEKYLGLNAEMLSLITTIYILFDPISTCVNTMGNGAFAKAIDKILFKITAKKIT